MSFFLEDILTSAKYRTLAPISQSTFQDPDLAIIADEELLLRLVGDIFKAREDFFSTFKQFPIVGLVTHYRIPGRSIGSTFKKLYFVDASGNYKPLDKIEADEKHRYSGQSAEPSKFYIQGDEIVLATVPSASGGFLEFEYYAKPNRLVLTTNCAKITAINTSAGTTTFTVDTDLTASLPVGAKVDFLSTASPYLLWADSVVITAITATTIAVSAASVSDPSGAIEPNINDYICPNGKANIPMIPEEFHPVLSQMLACRLLASLGDLNKLNVAKEDLKELRVEALALIKNRVESSPYRVNRKNYLTKAFGK